MVKFADFDTVGGKGAKGWEKRGGDAGALYDC